MDEKKKTASIGTYFAILLYYYLPRMQYIAESNFWSTIFGLRSLIVVIFTVAMLFITFQKAHSNKWKRVDLITLLVSAYGLFFVGTILFFILAEFR